MATNGAVPRLAQPDMTDLDVPRAVALAYPDRANIAPTVVLVFSPWLGWHTPGSAFGEPITRGLARRLADRGVTAVSLRIGGRCVDFTTAELAA